MQDDNIIQPKINRVDNLFEGNVFHYIHERVTDPLTPWGTYGIDKARDPRLYDWFQYTHVVYDSDTELSPLADVCKFILLEALDRTDRRLDRLFKIRIVNSMPGSMDRAQPHIDLVGPHQTGFYFPETTDGTTDIMFERSWLQTWDTPEKFNVAERLEPVGNTWYDTDGTHWRYTGRPEKHDQRFCVVFNFVASPK